MSCVRQVGFAEHGLRRLPRTRVVLTLGMAFPDVLRLVEAPPSRAPLGRPFQIEFWASYPDD